MFGDRLGRQIAHFGMYEVIPSLVLLVLSLSASLGTFGFAEESLSKGCRRMTFFSRFLSSSQQNTSITY
ncbi:MAG: hypothetical protein AMJ88_15940 [Anaerolineae bacterium SM23_ 63]|nr:MAG: hypothetical protein AMJ88_15940 [Anaerolineae bacterium SM23_ 63]